VNGAQSTKTDAARPTAPSLLHTNTNKQTSTRGLNYSKQSVYKLPFRRHNLAMKRREAWQLDYRGDPYLHHLPLGDLNERFLSLVTNETYINDEIKISFRDFTHGGEYWFPIITHVFEEFRRRARSLPPRQGSIVPRVDYPGLTAAVGPFKISKRTYPNVIVRYGKREHMRELFEEGQLQVSPASTYDADSFNAAIRDDELRLAVYRKSRLFTRVYDHLGYTLIPSGPKHGRFIETLTASTNYYVYCMTMERSLRLFGDFGYDACVIIHDPARFIRRLGAAGLNELGDGWSWFARPLGYIDPLRPPDSQLNIVHCKHFRFAYQSEFRFVWLPPTPVAELHPFKIQIGSIRDISTLIELPLGDTA
jgi:hypothetical protein